MNASRLKIEYLPVATLRPYERNARTHSAEQIAQIVGSIRAFGWTNPILADEADTVIAGHGRLAAATELGLEQVPVIRLAGLTEQERRALAIADNKLALNAGWNEMLLAAELQSLGDLQGLVGFSNDELLQLSIGVTKTELPSLPAGEKSSYCVVSFTLHNEQAAIVARAISTAKADGPFTGPNENSNGNALARICEDYLTAQSWHPHEKSTSHRSNGAMPTV